MLQHANSLKLSWQVFSEHRHLFVAIFADQTENTRGLPVVAWEKSIAGARMWRFDTPKGSLVQALEGSVALPARNDAPGAPQLDALMGLVTIPYFLPELRKNWPAWKPLVKDGKSNYIGPASVPMMALIHRRALLNSAFIRAAEEWIDAAAGQPK
jgi:hypothetical protein